MSKDQGILMKKIILYLLTLIYAGIIFFLSCKKERSCEGCINGNKPPIAVAGPDQVITLPTDSVSLDGNASSDPDGIISNWLWTKISALLLLISKFTGTENKIFQQSLEAGVSKRKEIPFVVGKWNWHDRFSYMSLCSCVGRN